MSRNAHRERDGGKRWILLFEVQRELLSRIYLVDTIAMWPAVCHVPKCEHDEQYGEDASDDTSCYRARWYCGRAICGRAE